MAETIAEGEQVQFVSTADGIDVRNTDMDETVGTLSAEELSATADTVRGVFEDEEEATAPKYEGDIEFGQVGGLAMLGLPEGSSGLSFRKPSNTDIGVMVHDYEVITEAADAIEAAA